MPEAPIAADGSVAGGHAIPRDFRQPRPDGQWSKAHREIPRPARLPAEAPAETAYLLAGIALVLAEAYEQDTWSLACQGMRITTPAPLAGRCVREVAAGIEAQLGAPDAVPELPDAVRVVLGGDAVVPVPDQSPTGSAAGTVTIVVRPSRATLTLSVGYSTAWYRTELLEELAAALAHGLALVIDDADTDAFAVLSADRGDAPPCLNTAPDSASLAALFDDAVAEHPNDIALRYADQRISYQELATAAGGLAAALAADPALDRRVVLYGNSCPELVAAILAAVRAGKSFTVVSPNEPAGRLAEMLDALGRPAVYVIAPGEPDHLDLTGASVTLAGADLRLVRTPLRCWSAQWPPAGSPSPRPAGHDELYTVFTSGSTGVPKGISMAEAAFTRFNAAFVRRFEVDPAAVVPLWAPLSYDASYYEVFGTLVAGGTLLIPLPEDRASAAATLRWLTDRRASHFQAVPSVLTHLLDARLAQTDSDSLRTVRWLLSTGEPVPHQLVELISASPGLTAQYANMYGPTECVLATWAVVGPDELASQRLPAGRPIADRAVFVVDRHGRPKQPGFIGEITIVSRGLAHGYLGQATLAEPFFHTADAALGFRTGDLGRFRPDGQLEVLNRIAAMVKRHGVRIEPGELEVRLSGLASVDRCIVLNAGTAEAVRLAAFLTAAEGCQLSEFQVRAGMPTVLPPQLFPDEIYVVPQIPTLRSGKADRQALLALRAESVRQQPDHDCDPAGHLEGVVCQVFAEVLGVAWVGATDNFFALGGHSLAAAEVVDRLAEYTGAQVDLFAIFGAPVVRELAALLADRIGDSAASLPGDPAAGGLAAGPRAVDPRLDVGPLPATGFPELPLSVTQVPIWTSHQLSPESSRHSVSMAFLLDGEPDWQRLRSALQRVVDSQPALRASFGIHDGSLRQSIRPARPVDFDLIAEAPLELADAAARVRRLGARPFDIEHDQLLRATAIRCTRNRWAIAVTTHHLVCDEESLHVMAGQLERFYQHPEAPVPALEAGYRQFVRDTAAGREQPGQAEFWRALFAEIEDVRPVRAGMADSLQPVTTELLVTPQVTAQLRRLAASMSATPSMALMNIVAEVTAHHLDQPAVVLETAVSLREAARDDGLVGCFANTLAIPHDSRRATNLATSLHRFRTAMLGAMAHREVDYANLREHAGGWAPAGCPMADVVVAVHQKPAARPQLAGLSVSPFEHHAPYLRSPLATYWRPTADGGLRCEVEADETLYPPDRLADLTAELERCLSRARPAELLWKSAYNESVSR